MDTNASASRLVPTLAATAVSIAAIAAAAATWAGREPAPQRPPADAPVRVVKSPAPPAVDRLPVPCATCTMGAPGRQL